jgi:hypothetical protein
VTDIRQGDSEGERQSSELARSQKRYLKARYILQALRKRKGRLLVTLIGLALIFSAVAVFQHWFVHRQVYQTTTQELSSWAEQIAGEIAYEDKWDLKGYRQANILAPTWYVLTRDGLIIDIDGLFIPGIFGRAYGPDDSVFHGLPTEVGETWRLFQKKVEGGHVIVGISLTPENASVADSMLKDNAEKFGSTLAEATSVKGREIDGDVEYAVLSSDGELKTAWGGVPLKVDTSALPAPSDHVGRLISNGKPYLLYFQPIVDKQHQSVGTIIVPKDMSLEEQALRSQDRFNLSIVAIAAVLAIVTALTLITRELFSQTREVTLEEALKIGESRTIEFKSTFQWDVYQNKINRELQLAALKSIAGLLNAEGGTLFIGVAEDEHPPSVRGLAEDLDEMKGSRDKLQLTLRNLISDRIGSAYSYLVTDNLNETGGKLYWAVVVKESPEPVFVRWQPKHEPKERKIFYVREGPKTSDLDNESTYHYIKNKWR